MAVRPPLRQDPPQVRADSWWARPEVQQSRERFDAVHAVEAQRMNAVSTTQHIQRKDGDR